MPAAKWDRMYKADSEQGKKALAQLEKMSLGETASFPLVPSLTESAQWELQEKPVNLEANPAVWKLTGRFCGIPFYKLSIELTEGKLGMKVEEIP